MQILSTGVQGATGVATISQTTGMSFSSSQPLRRNPHYPQPILFHDVDPASTSNQQTSQAIELQIPEDSLCAVKFKQTSCTRRGSGRVPFVARGRVS
ncbi:hypothetical protein BD626DRAFT_20247 [Schizophyllum amplum]|uniref:Uncharacterized protein n=1 Tax=Schizophyllum amplum TaxID=97359 RepID=A0A550CYN4_9AGAR|nr:hypothetical protein BD626DRAFT_20247 [Auriculariopsis ampla]